MEECVDGEYQSMKARGGKALRDDDPVDRARDDGQAGPTAAVVGLYTCAQAFDVATDRLIVRSHHPHRCVVADNDARHLRLAEIRDGVPLVGLDEREQRMPGDRICAFGDLQSDHRSIVRGQHRREA